MAAIVRTSVSFVNNRFFITGSEGYISHSTDGVNWTTLNIGTVKNINAVAFGNTYYVVVGDAGLIAYSNNLTTWTISAPTSSNLNWITYAASKFVICGDNGVIYYGTTGTTWALYASGTTANLRRVRNVNSIWVAVGSGGTLTSSTNGTTWTVQSVDSRPLYGIASKSASSYSAGKKASSNGVTWTSYYSNNSVPLTAYPRNWSPVDYWDCAATDNFFGYIFANSYLYYCIGYGNLGPGGFGWRYCGTKIPSSSTGTTSWTTFPSGSTASYNYPYKSINAFQCNSIIFGGSAYDARYPSPYPFTNQLILPTSPYSYCFVYTSHIYAAFWNGSTYVYICREQAQHWTGSNWALDNYEAQVVRYNTSMTMNVNNYVAEDPIELTRWNFPSGTKQIFPFDIGTWYSVDNPNSQPYPLLQYDAAYGLGKYVLVGPRASQIYGTDRKFTVVYSTDAVNWSSVEFAASAGYDTGGRLSIGSNEIVMSCKWYNNGTPGWVMRTTDCVNYTYHFTGYSSTVNEVKYLRGYHYTVHDNGGIARSADGITWTTLVATASNSVMSYDVYDISYINGTYVLCGNNGYYQTSTNLSTWTTYSSGGPSTFIYKDTSQLISFGGGYIRTSTDGFNWTNQALLNGSSIAFGASKFVVTYSAAGTKPKYSSAITGPWVESDLGVATGVGVVIRDSNGNTRLQSYDPTAVNYLMTRVVQENYVAGTNTTIYVTGSNGYQIFVMVTPDGGSAGGSCLPSVTYGRGGAPDYQPYFTLTYPPYGGGGSTYTNANVYCTVFTTGSPETISY